MGVDEPEEQQAAEWRTSTCGERLHSRLHPTPSTFLDYPNFERSCCSDVKQISGTVANPVASPQPVVGIHFEVIIGEGLIKKIKKKPSCSSNSLGEPHIHQGWSTHKHQRTGYNVTRSDQVYAAVVAGAPIHRLASAQNWKYVEEKEWAAAVYPAVLILYTEMLMMLVVNSASDRRCHPFFFPPLLRSAQLLLLFWLFPSNFCTEPGCVALRSNAQVNPGRHD